MALFYTFKKLAVTNHNMSVTVGGLGSSAIGGLEMIRADNADQLDAAVHEKKRAKSGKTPKQAAAPKPQKQSATGDPGPSTRPTPSVLRVPASIAKKVAKDDKARAARGNPNYLKKLTIIQRYMDNRMLAPILIDRVSPTVYAHQPKTEEEADAKLQAFKVALNTNRMDNKVDHLLAMAATGVVYATNNGTLFNMDLTGYVERIWADKADVAVELEEFKCEWGSFLSAPWHVRLAMYFVQKAKETDSANNFLVQPADTKGKGPA